MLQFQEIVSGCATARGACASVATFDNSQSRELVTPAMPFLDRIKAVARSLESPPPALLRGERGPFAAAAEDAAMVELE